MIYLDNSATSRPKPPEVIQAMNDFLNNVCANSGRSGHRLAIQASRIVYDTREVLAQLFNISDPLQIVFTMNATESINLALLGLLQGGDHVITSSIEHNSVMRPLRMLESHGVELSVIKCSKTGFIDPDDVKKQIKKNTKMIALNHASNVTGSIQPAKEIGKIARENEIIFILDSAQTAGNYPIDVEDMNIDLLAFTGHKSLCGPQGTGGLYIRKGINLKPIKFGGTGSQSDEEFQPDFMPDRYESGTLNLVGIAGLGAGVRFIIRKGIDSIRKKECELTQMMIDGLLSIHNVSVYGDHNAEHRVGVISFNIEGLLSSESALILEDEFDILCRSGLHCAPSAHKTIDTFPEGTIRFSLGIFSTKDDVIESVNAVRKIAENKEHGF
ncbi:TPA: aminotransferase class V-fold PLP-dependent enzyme [bacterium]|nr:aminotransferase class V-fold PLP-dependent enzyme [bacterium]